MSQKSEFGKWTMWLPDGKAVFCSLGWLDNDVFAGYGANRVQLSHSKEDSQIGLIEKITVPEGSVFTRKDAEGYILKTRGFSRS